jgi:hypothetical protein
MGSVSSDQDQASGVCKCRGSTPLIYRRTSA